MAAALCPGCGAPQALSATQSDKSILVATLLCLSLGILGIHRFYVGKKGTGLLQMFTLGGFYIWAIIDFCIIVTGNFRDADGKPLS
jgi:TM2 domain-containing membrane protein YozV